jgi:hypothetical protein
VVDLHNQVLSRRIALGLGEQQTVLDFNRPGQLWRLSVQELDTLSSLLIQVNTGFANSQETIQFHCAPGSAVEYVGCNSATVEIQAVQAATTLDVQISPYMDNQFVLERDEGRQAINTAAWTPIGSPRPYMNYAAIMTNLNIDVRTITGANVLFQALNLAPQTLLLNQFKMGNHDQLEVRGTAIAPATQNVRVVWYNRR